MDSVIYQIAILDVVETRDKSLYKKEHDVGDDIRPVIHACGHRGRHGTVVF
jgi:hypothetical protein